jgi:hypothetical protein
MWHKRAALARISPNLPIYPSNTGPIGVGNPSPDSDCHRKGSVFARNLRLDRKRSSGNTRVAPTELALDT